ncbi:WS/DGAT/MGAT family O-acyltransferase [Actinomadura harenae]|uniref:Diacylglycerol O-acyltransferase n=1 Tax=Actinomadura harenae TaxID=2483351 RepID=A0A3M2M9V1_9ACTN|nr:wax ester/triacylglycerol synthase family O-acyltransferase [Actinomadura harenae]RMI46564.1 wax ester/triacylglycerol synthase family O-acyltransferase [Actinomadura harenae]
MTQLTTLDATFLHAESGGTHAHIAGLGILDPGALPGGRVTVAAAVELIRERAHLAARPLRQRLAAVPFGLDHPYWEDDPGFDPARHVSEMTLPAPGTAAQLAEAIAELHARPLERGRPLWELVLVQGLEGGRAAVYVKAHHAAVDGVLAAETLAALLDLSPQPRELPADDAAPLRAPSPFSRVGTGLLRTAAHPFRAALSVARTAPHLDEVPGVAALPGVARVSHAVQGALGMEPVPEAPRVSAPPTPFNGPVGPHRAVAFADLPLAEVKRVRTALGGSVNDVVMAVCASALRTWLDKRGALPDGPLVAGVPVSLRPTGAGGAGSEAGNQVSLMSAPLAVHVPDPADRYAAVRDDMERAKRRFVGSSGAWVRDLTGLVPAPLAGPVARLALSVLPGLPVRPLNLIVSNVPGPQFPLYLCGARVLAYYPLSVVSGVSGGLNITVFSYDGTVHVGLVTCRDLVPDPDELVDHLADALNELTALAGE